MPFALLTIGMILVVTGFQNTYKQFGAQVAGDFSGQNNFFYWVVAIGIVGALGYNDTLKPFSRAFLVLIIVGIMLSNGKGFFSRLNSDVQAGSNTAVLPIGGSQSSGGGGSGDGGGSDLLKDVGTVASIAAMF